MHPESGIEFIDQATNNERKKKLPEVFAILKRRAVHIDGMKSGENIRLRAVYDSDTQAAEAKNGLERLGFSPEQNGKRVSLIAKFENEAVQELAEQFIFFQRLFRDDVNDLKDKMEQVFDMQKEMGGDFSMVIDLIDSFFSAAAGAKLSIEQLVPEAKELTEKAPVEWRGQMEAYIQKKLQLQQLLAHRPKRLSPNGPRPN